MLQLDAERSSARAGADHRSTQRLIQAALRGDQGAFQALHERYLDPLRRIVQRRFSPELGSHLEPEDILQETFLSAFERLSTYQVRPESDFLAWLCRIAEHKLMDAIRFLRREKRTPQAGYFLEQQTQDTGELGRVTVSLSAGRGGASGSAELANSSESLRWRGLDPLGELERREDREAVWQCLIKMSPELREVVVMREWRETPWRAVARNLGRETIGAARHLHSVACDELARLLSSQQRDLDLELAQV